jgi:hypothetical protein
MDERNVENGRSGETSCPACRAPADRGQLVCLECGTRLALDYRRPTGWKLPLAIVTGVLLLAGGGLALALGSIEEAAESDVAETRPTGERRPEGKAKARAEPRKGRRAKRPARRPSPPRAGTWPRGRNGFTVVLGKTEDRRSAISLTRSIRGRGNSAGYLRSDDYSSLDPGSWTVFSGVYRTRPEAERASDRLARAVPGAFSEFVNGAERRPRR